MVTMFGRQRGEGGLDARIAEISALRERAVEAPQPPPTDGEAPAARPTAPTIISAPPQVGAPEATMEERLAVAREELSARLGEEIRPERRALLSRGDLAKIVDAAVQAYFVRHAMDANPLSRRDLVTDIMQTLLAPGGGGTDAANRHNPH